MTRRRHEVASIRAGLPSSASTATRFSCSSLLPCRGHLGCRRLCDREDIAHIRGECLAKAFGIGWHRPPLVPLNGKPLSNGLALVCYADNSQPVAIRAQERRNDADPLSGFGKRQQGVGCPALEQNIGLDMCETASCVKQPAN